MTTLAADGRTKEEQEYRERTFYWICRIWPGQKIAKPLQPVSGRTSTTGPAKAPTRPIPPTIDKLRMSTHVIRQTPATTATTTSAVLPAPTVPARHISLPLKSTGGRTSTTGPAKAPTRPRHPFIYKLQLPSIFTHTKPVTTLPTSSARLPAPTAPARRLQIPEIRITAASPARRLPRGPLNPAPTDVNSVEETERVPSPTTLMAAGRIGKRSSSEREREGAKRRRLWGSASVVAGLIRSNLRASARNKSRRIPPIITQDPCCTLPESIHNDRLAASTTPQRSSTHDQNTVIVIEDEPDTAKGAQPNAAGRLQTAMTTSAPTSVVSVTDLNAAEDITEDLTSLTPSLPGRQARAIWKPFVPRKSAAIVSAVMAPPASPQIIRCNITRRKPFDAVESAPVASRSATSKQAPDSSLEPAQETDALNP